MIIAIYELNGKKLKTTNLTKKLKKLKQTPTILFQQEFEGSIKEAESILDEQLKEEEVVDYNNDVVLHHFKNYKTGYTITSIYDYVMIKIMKRLIDRYYFTKINNNLDDCQDILELAFLLKKENSQGFLAWEDALNRISTVW